MAENNGNRSENKDNLIHRLAGWIPTHVSVKVIIAVYWLMDKLMFIGKKRRREHRENNLAVLTGADSPMKDGFIENQHSWDRVLLGKTTMAEAGCEIMAVYNALLALGLGKGPELISELIERFEKHGAALHGRIGTSPLELRSYLKKRGIKTKWSHDADRTDPETKVAIVMLYNNRDDLFDMIHTITYTKDETAGFVPHNTWHNKPGYPTLKEAIEGSGLKTKVICIMEII
ncbi:MAG: hypothetical protein K6G69_02965 [Lachnospiraceae bacterium]|nr:hypothetical protein [Lachnospiraceae bacterium]